MATRNFTNTYNNDLDIIEYEVEDLRNNMLTRLETGCGEALYPGDERRIFGEAMVAVFVLLYSVLNDAVRQCLLNFAHGQALDAIGARVNCTRLEATPAKTTIRFSLSAVRSENIIIPKWTKVSVSGDHYFATDEETVITAGAYNVDVTATALDAGTENNGILANTITTLVDNIPYVTGVTNLTETAGGEDGEPYTDEGDNAYRERIRIAPEAFSTAGPRGAYEYWAMTSDAGVQDCVALTPTVDVDTSIPVNDGTAVLDIDGLHLADTLFYPNSSETAAVYDTDYTLMYTGGKLTVTPKEDGALADAEMIDIKGKRDLAGHVMIYALMDNSKLPTDAQCESILEIVNREDIRPMCDYVEVHAPNKVYYDIEITYYCSTQNAASVLTTVEGTDGALVRYQQWQGEKIGRNINPDELRKLLLKPDWSDAVVGVSRATITAPSYTVVKDDEVAVCRSVVATRVIE